MAAVVIGHRGDVYDLSLVIVFIDRSGDRQSVASRERVGSSTVSPLERKGVPAVIVVDHDATPCRVGILNEERPLCDNATLNALESYLKKYGISET